MAGIKLSIIEDNETIRKTLYEFMSLQNGISSVSTYNLVESFLWENEDSTPIDVVLLDIQLPKRDGLDGINDILLKYPHVNILMYTMFMDSQSIIKSLSLGAVGYILKRNSLQEIYEAIQIVYDGGSYLSPLVARKVLNHFHPSSVIKKKVELTQREEQVVNGLIQAMSYQAIADSLNVSIDTVRTYVRKIYTKMQVNSKTQLLVKIQNYLGGILK